MHDDSPAATGQDEQSPTVEEIPTAEEMSPAENARPEGRGLTSWFSNLKTKPKILLGICAPLVLTLALGAIAIFNVDRIMTTNKWVDHTHVVLAEAKSIIGSAVDMETGMRGYLLAGRETFLDPYKNGETDTYKRISDLQKTVSDNPGQVARLGEVEKVLREWQSKVTEPTIVLRRKIGDAETMNDMAKLVGEARGKTFSTSFGAKSRHLSIAKGSSWTNAKPRSMPPSVTLRRPERHRMTR